MELYFCFYAKIALAFGVACAIGILAQIKFYLPWTPIPVTMQTFGVLLAGILLGGTFGGISLAIYITLGVAGVPWFVGLAGGFSVLVGPTGGFLVGFMLAAMFIGYVAERFIKTRHFLPIFILLFFANIVLIYVPGLLQLGIWLHLSNVSDVTVLKLIDMGVVPFVLGDIVKILLAAMLAKIIAPYSSKKDSCGVKQ